MIGRFEMKHRLIPCFLVLLFAGCAQTVQHSPITAPLPIVDLPDYRPGDTWTWQTPDGGRLTDRIVRVDGDILYAKSSVTPGCSITMDTNIFAPATARSNCVGITATQKVDSTGSLFPLKLGNRQSWKVTRTTEAGKVRKYAATCVVADTARVTVPAGTFDTYVIRCQSDTRDRDWYFAPAINSPVIYLRKSVSKGLRYEQLVSFERG